MGDVTQFPGRPTPPSSEDQARRKRNHDVLYARDAIKAALPSEVLRLISGENLLVAARAAVSAVDEARHRRRFETDYDQRRSEGVLGALDRMFLGDTPPDPGGAA